MFRRLSLGLAMVFGVIAQIPAGLTGTWEGTSTFGNADHNSSSLPLVMVLRQDGDTFAGSVGPDADHQLLLISNGKITGSTFSFDVSNGEAKINIVGQLNGRQTSGDFRTINKQGVAITGAGEGSVRANEMTFHWSGTRNDGATFSGHLRFTKADR
jgi:hypothetical protein